MNDRTRFEPQQVGSNGSGGLIARWGMIVTDHPWRVLGVSLAAIVLFAMVALPLSGDFNDSFSLPGSESQQAYDLLEEQFPQQAGSTANLVFESTIAGGITSAESQSEIQAILDEVLTQEHVVGILSPFDSASQISVDGTIAYATIYYDMLSDTLPVSAAENLVAVVDSTDSSSLHVEAGGEVVLLVDEEEPGGTAELIGLSAAAIILLIAFGSVVAMGLPIVTAVLGLFTGAMGILLATRFIDVPTFSPFFASMIGIGVGIDYALFIVTRFREGLANGLNPKEATIRSLDTAGRAVIFAGMVVVISMLGLSVVGIPFVTALGLAAAMVVTSAVTVAIVVLPALLTLIGPRIDRWSIRRPRTGTHDRGDSFARKLSQRIQEHPGRYFLVSAGLLLILALPILRIDLGWPDAGSSPTSYYTRQAYDLMTKGFGEGFNSPLLIVAFDQDGVPQSSIDELTSALEATENVVQVDEPIVNEAGTTAVITSFPREGSDADSTKDLVATFRDDLIPTTLDGTSTTAYVGGPAASFIDFSDTTIQRTPYVFLVVLGLSFLLLTVVFRSPVIAIKAAVMNLLSISAAFGIVVAIFQFGWGANLIGVEESQPIIIFMPLFLFAILFGLSMDYEVFLLSRIREFWVHGMPTSEAVSEGLAVTARVITAAAAIMVAVFLSFVALNDPITKQFGLGMAVAILIDATIVRLVLVPSTMELLGERNWWFPSWLDRITPHVNIEGKSDLPSDVEVVPGMAD